jgi:hypothetical protein
MFCSGVSVKLKPDPGEIQALQNNAHIGRNSSAAHRTMLNNIKGTSGASGQGSILSVTESNRYQAIFGPNNFRAFNPRIFCLSESAI